MAGTRQHPAPTVDAGALRAWLALALQTCESAQDLVDSLNVFPVPDSDTGTNVLLTVRAAMDALSLLPEGADAVQVSRAAADGAVRGARGNSGLLVSQALAALADVTAQAPDPQGLRPVELVRAYERIASSTWQAVSRPVAGTLLTVAADAATAARAALEESDTSALPSVADLAAAAALGAQESVVETAGLGHGPIDAGGAALMLILTALSDTLALSDLQAGEPGNAAPLTDVAHQMLTDLAGSAPHAAASGARGEPALPEASTGEFEVMYLLEATAAQAAGLRQRLEAVGDSVGVVGTPDALGVGLYQVHVHTDTPRAALPRAGRARQVCIHHLQPTAKALAGHWESDDLPLTFTAAQVDAGRVVSFERLAFRRGATGSAPDAARQRPGPRTGVIACTRAPGLIEQLARTGAVVVLNPEREGILRAAGDLGAGRLLVLPCDQACAASAHEAARHLAARSLPSVVSGPHGRRTGRSASHAAGPHLLVADTDNEARTLAAAVAVAGQVQDEDLAALALRAARAGAGMRTAAYTGALAEPETVSRAVSAQLRAEDELVTVILGRDALPDTGSLLASAVAQRAQALHGAPDAIEVVVHAGGQLVPDVLVACE